MSTKKKKKRKKKQHRFFWFVIKLQIVLMLVVLAGFGYYYFGGYADQIQQMRREAVQEVSASDDSTFIPSQISIKQQMEKRSFLIKTEN